MATVTVSTWEQLVSAAQGEGDTVVITPGTEIIATGKLTIACAEIKGNGAKITIDSRAESCAVDVVSNAVIGDVYFVDVRFSDVFLLLESTAGEAKINSCDFTGRNYGSTDDERIIKNLATSSIKRPEFFRCVFNIDAGNGVFSGEASTGGRVGGQSPYYRYCNIEYSGANFASARNIQGTILAFGTYFSGEYGAAIKLDADCRFVVVNARCDLLENSSSIHILANKSRVETIDAGLGAVAQVTALEMSDPAKIFKAGFLIMDKKVIEWRQ
ncbi:MAG: hypothetical protein J6A30_09715 [Ruminococcus sp.]|nr:hypothetical protein [Ruminococcus sp.]